MINAYNHEKKTLCNVRMDIWICLFIVVSILCVYGPVKNFPFVNYDDGLYVTDNYHVQAGLTLENIRWSLTATRAGNWHPLTWISHMLDCFIYGMNPGHHHVTNVILHILNSLLLFFIFKNIAGSIWKSAFVAALFALHPLHVESVAWIAERKDVLSTFFLMLCLWSYAGYVESSRRDKYLLLILFYILGLMSKPMLVTLPFVLLLLDYWPLKRFQLKSKHETPEIPKPFYFGLILEKIPLILLSGASCAVTYLVQKSTGSVSSLVAVPFHLRIANALVSYISYIKKMFWPHNLAVLYPYQSSIPMWKIIGAGMLLIMISVFVFRMLRSKPYLAVGWLWYLVTLVPVIGIVQVGRQALADRYTYVPSIGIFIMLTWLGADWVSKRHYQKFGLFIAAASILSILMITSRMQLKYWSNSVALFEHAIDVTGDNSTAQLNLGAAFAVNGNIDKAAKHYEAALKIRPNLDEANLNIGVYLRGEGKLNDAIDHFSKVLSKKSRRSAAAHYELGETMESKGDLALAVKHYLEAIKMNPGYAMAYNNIGVILAAQNKDKAAIIFFSKAIQINPGYAGAHFNLGKIFFNQNDPEKAISQYKKAIHYDPNMIQALYQLSWMLSTHENERYRNGKEAAQLAIRLCKITQFRQPLAMDALAAAYAETGRYNEAVSIAEKAYKMALVQGPKTLARGLEQRLKLYQNKKPYHQALSGKRTG